MTSGYSIAEARRLLRDGGVLCVAILHPLATAGDFNGDDVDSSFVVERPYFQPELLVDPIERDGFELVFHSMHRPLGAYTAALRDAGFRIEVLSEPVPDEAAVRDHPRLARQLRIPNYLHIRAVCR